jgi:hypothetical protein
MTLRFEGRDDAKVLEIVSRFLNAVPDLQQRAMEKTHA